MRTRAHTHINTHRQTLAQMPHRRSPSPTRTLSLCCCQIKAWKAGHKGDCVAAARADTRTAAKPTADQMCVLKMLEQLAGAADWRGVSAQERAARAVAAAVRTSMPRVAAWVYSTLGNAYQKLGSFSKAIEYHTQRLAIAKEVGDRAGEGRAYANLGNSYQSQGDFSKAIEYHTKDLAITKEAGGGGHGVREPRQRVSVAGGLQPSHRVPRAVPGDCTGGGRPGRGGRGVRKPSATRMSRRGTMSRPSSTTGSTWRLQRRWATGRGRAMRTRTLGARISRRRTSA